MSYRSAAVPSAHGYYPSTTSSFPPPHHSGAGTLHALSQDYHHLQQHVNHNHIHGSTVTGAPHHKHGHNTDHPHALYKRKVMGWQLFVKNNKLFVILFWDLFRNLAGDVWWYSVLQLIQKVCLHKTFLSANIEKQLWCKFLKTWSIFPGFFWETGVKIISSGRAI